MSLSDGTPAYEPLVFSRFRRHGLNHAWSKILKLFTMASKTPLFVIFALGTAVFIAAKKSLIPEWIGFGLLVLLSLSIRVFLTKS